MEESQSTNTKSEIPEKILHELSNRSNLNVK